MSYTHYVLGPILGAEDTAVKKILKILPLECYIPVSEINKMEWQAMISVMGKLKQGRGCGELEVQGNCY